MNTKNKIKNQSEKGSQSFPIIPLSDRVILSEIEGGDTKTASGIIIPDSASIDKETKKGLVVAVGEGRLIDGVLQKPAVKIGDKVLYSWGDNIVIEGKKYVIVGADNISAIIKI
jgi:chaperonin GroES